MLDVRLIILFVAFLFSACTDYVSQMEDDFEEWKTAADIIDMRDKDPAFVGYQYVDFEIEGEDIIFLSRTADNNAASFHDTNYQTFHRIKDFRKLIKE